MNYICIYLCVENFEVVIKEKVLLLFLLLLAPSGRLFLQEIPDSCLKFYWEPTIGFQNPDSVKIDTCIDSPTYNHIFAKEFFTVQFEYNVLPRVDSTYGDSIVEYRWYDIDTNYNETRNGFSELEKKFGTFYFREIYRYEPDTTENEKRQLRIRFDEYVDVDTVVGFIKTIPLLTDVLYILRAGVLVDIKSEKLNSNNEYSIYPQPANDILHIHAKTQSQTTIIDIINMIGQIVFTKKYQSENLINLNISYLNPGVYILKINNFYIKIIII